MVLKVFQSNYSFKVCPCCPNGCLRTKPSWEEVEGSLSTCKTKTGINRTPFLIPSLRLGSRLERPLEGSARLGIVYKDNDLVVGKEKWEQVGRCGQKPELEVALRLSFRSKRWRKNLLYAKDELGPSPSCSPQRQTSFVRI